MFKTIKILGKKKVVKFTRRGGLFSALHPIIQNKAFPPGLGMSVFQCWYDQGIKIVGDQLKDGKLLSVIQIRTKYVVPSQHFYGYLQVRHFINSLNFPETQLATSATDSFLLQFCGNKKIISHFYGKLQSFNTSNIDRIKSLWSRDFGIEIGDEAWSKGVESVGKMFLCNRLTDS